MTNGPAETELVASDELLVAHARGGSQRAFTALVTRYERRLYAYLSRMLGDPADAEDAFQETFVRVFRSISRFRTGSAFRPWLYCIATNVCKDALRRRARFRSVNVTDNKKVVELQSANAAGPGSQAQAAEVRERLEAAVARLPEKQRAVFLMARYQDMPYREIARALRIPPGTVKSRMNAAVNSLLLALEES